MKAKGGIRHKTSELEKAHLTGEFIMVANFGDHVLHCLASSLSNVIRQVDRQTKNSSLGNFLEFSTNILSGFDSAKTIP